MYLIDIIIYSYYKLHAHVIKIGLSTVVVAFSLSSNLLHKSTQPSTQVFFIVEAVFWDLISLPTYSITTVMSNMPHNSKLFIAHSVFLVVLTGHSPFLKVGSKSSSPILKLNHSYEAAAEQCFLGLLAACNYCWALNILHYLRPFKDNGQRVNGLKYTVSEFFN